MPVITSTPTPGDRIMHGEPADGELSPRVDVRVGCPDNGVIRIESALLSADADGLLCRRFVGRVLLAPEIDSVVITPAIAKENTTAIELQFDATQYSPRQVLELVAALLDAAPNAEPDIEVPPALTARDRRGVVRFYRYRQRATGWKVISERI